LSVVDNVVVAAAHSYAITSGCEVRAGKAMLLVIPLLSTACIFPRPWACYSAVDPIKFIYGIFDSFLLVSSIVGALLTGKWIAAWLVGRANGYNPSAQLTIWSLTLPQVAATLAATLVAHQTLNAAGQLLLDDRMLNVVLVLVFATAMLGPVLTERFASRMAAAPREGTQG